MYICWFQNFDWFDYLRRKRREYVIQIESVFSTRFFDLLRFQKFEFAIFASMYVCENDSRMKIFDKIFDKTFVETFVETFNKTFDKTFDKTFNKNRFDLKKTIRENYIDHDIFE